MVLRSPVSCCSKLLRKASLCQSNVLAYLTLEDPETEIGPGATMVGVTKALTFKFRVFSIPFTRFPNALSDLFNWFKFGNVRAALLTTKCGAKRLACVAEWDMRFRKGVHYSHPKREHARRP